EELRSGCPDKSGLGAGGARPGQAGSQDGGLRCCGQRSYRGASMTHFRRASRPRGGKADARVTTELPLSIGSLFIVLLLLVMPSNGWAYPPFISTHAAGAGPPPNRIRVSYLPLRHHPGSDTLTISDPLLQHV